MSKEQRDTIKEKIKRYYRFYKDEEWFNFPNADYPEIENLKNMRVLVITDVGDQEHQNLIQLARDIDEKKKESVCFGFSDPLICI